MRYPGVVRSRSRSKAFPSRVVLWFDGCFRYLLPLLQTANTLQLFLKLAHRFFQCRHTRAFLVDDLCRGAFDEFGIAQLGVETLCLSAGLAQGPIQARDLGLVLGTKVFGDVGGELGLAPFRCSDVLAVERELTEQQIQGLTMSASHYRENADRFRRGLVRQDGADIVAPSH